MAISLDDLAAKLEEGEQLSAPDIDVLASTKDIISLGMLANAFRRKIHGSEVTYVRVADVKLPEMGFDPFSAGEVRVFQTPATLDAAVEVVTKVRERAGNTPVSAFCLFELSKFPEGLPVVLPALKKAGLELITQVPIDKVAAPEQAFEAVTDAGLQLARLTVNEWPERPWTAVCAEIAAHQTKLGSIRAFAPLPRKIEPTEPTTGYEDVKRIAISRLIAHNVATIQVDWALYGPKLAQVALTFGADDIDSVSPSDDDSQGYRRSPVQEIHRGIRAAGFEPIERDARFERRG